MKKLTKSILFILTIVLSLSSFACTRRDEGIQIDHTKTQLYVSIYDGGYGSAWADSLATRFEDFYKNETFESGKTGVQVVVSTDANSATGQMGKILTSRNEVFFSPEVYYSDYCKAGVFADITDIVKGDLSEYGDTGTIEDKLLNDAQKEYLTMFDNKYYALPGEMMFSGISYDVELFESEGYFFRENPIPGMGIDGYFIEPGQTDGKSKGPDGKTGVIEGVDYSLDDGLPATYEEFFMLCEYIYTGGNVPLIWSGQYSMGYIGWLLQALMADYEGAEQMLLNYSFDGTAKNIISDFDADDNPIFKDPLTITAENGYEMFQTAGRYYALKFVEQMVSNQSYYDAKSFNVTHSHTDAQLDFLMSKLETKKIAMFIDGCYWESEATSDFESMVSKYQDESLSKKNRKFAMMSFPKATEDKIGEKNTLVEGLYCMSYIRGNLSGFKLDLAKKFLKFAYTNASLVDFATITSTPRGVKTTYTETDLSKMSYFGRSVINLANRSDVVFPVSTKPIYLANQSTFNNKYTFVANIKGTTYNDPTAILRPSDINHKSAKEFFLGIGARYTNWATDYSQWFN